MFGDDGYDAKSDRNITFEDDDIEQSRLFCIIGYFVFVVPLIYGRKKESQFAIFHANQALLCFLAFVVTCLVGLIPTFGLILMLICGCIVWLPMFFKGISGAVAGEARRVPYIGFLNLINY
jgi:uncharacterized membrane protein